MFYLISALFLLLKKKKMCTNVNNNNTASDMYKYLDLIDRTRFMMKNKLKAEAVQSGYPGWEKRGWECLHRPSPISIKNTSFFSALLDKVLDSK